MRFSTFARYRRNHLGGAPAIGVPDSCNKDDLTRIVFEAHRTLSEINPQNQQAFQGVLDSMRSKLDSP